MRTVLILALVFSAFVIDAQESSRDTSFSVSGRLTASDEESQGGYFAIGQELTLMVKPDTPLHAFLNSRRDTNVLVMVEHAP